MVRVRVRVRVRARVTLGHLESVFNAPESALPCHPEQAQSTSGSIWRTHDQDAELPNPYP